jgi:ABC-type sugar transport system substrate-binding protein
VLASGIGNYQQPVARDVMVKMLKEHGQIDAALVANDNMALGAAQEFDLERAARATTSSATSTGAVESAVISVSIDLFDPAGKPEQAFASQDVGEPTKQLGFGG